MPRYFSPAVGGFFDDQVHGPREIAAEQSAKDIERGRKPKMIANPATLIPADAIEIGDDEFAKLMDKQADGLEIIARGGRPVAINPRGPDKETLRTMVRSRRNQILAATDAMVTAPDYPISEAEKTELLAYREALRDAPLAVDESTATVRDALPAAPVWLRDRAVVNIP